MSGGGGGSGNDGSNDTDVSGAEAVATGGSTYSDRKIDNSVNYTSRDNVRAAQMHNQHHRARWQAAQVDSDDEYDTPDKAHWKDTQKQIKQHTKGDHYDIKMSPKEYDKFNEDMNKYYGTKDVKYEPYGRAGQGTVNLTFKEHWDNIGHQSPALKFSPTLRFLAAAGRNIGEFLTSDYGTYKYGGPGRDKGGLLGHIGTGDGGTWQPTATDRDVMRNLAPEAPYIVSGTQKPTDSPAAKWYQSLGQTNTSGFTFSFANELAAAKAKQATILGNPSAVGILAVSNSPFYNFLKERNLDKGIL